MVAGVELPAGAFWRDSRCQRAARETNTKGGLYRCHGCTCRIIICPESGEKEGDRLRDPGPRAAAMERARLPPGLSTRTSALKPWLLPSLGNPQPEPREEEPKERARRGKKGWVEGGRGRDPWPHLPFPLPSSSGGNLCCAPARLPPHPLNSGRPSPPLPSLTPHPSCSSVSPYRVPPPLPLAPLPSSSSSCSSFSEAGDGQRARAAQQLQIHCSPLQLPAPPSLSPPRCPPAPVALLGQRRHRRLALPASCAAQPSRAPRMALYPQDWVNGVR
nr:splicing factor 1-like [Macaca fascicularis]